MNSFDFYSPTYFVFGRDRENDTGKYVAKFGGSRVLIVYGGQSAKRSGLLDRVKASVNAAGLYSIELGGVKSNPKSGFVYEGIELARREKIDFLVAIGGGSVIDTAKAIAMGVPYDGDFWDFFSGKTPETALPDGVVLTLAASGSEGSGQDRSRGRLHPPEVLRHEPCSYREPARFPDRLRRDRHHLSRAGALLHQHSRS